MKPYVRITFAERDGRTEPVIEVEPDPREPVVDPDPREEAES